MASKEANTNNEELNFLFKSMGQRGKEGEIWKKYTEHCLLYLLQQFSEYLSRHFDNCLTLRAYGSAVEDLKSIAPDDVGDLDITICPKSDELMIYDEMIEYSENPMHVRIKAVDHHVLRSCLMEYTQYVATSALKNFHPAIFGRSTPHLLNYFIRTLQTMPGKVWANVSLEWQNKDASPALQIEYKQSFGPISGELEKLKNPQTSRINIDVAEWEWLAQLFCTSKGIKYSREHADVFKEYIEYANGVQTSYHENGLLSRPDVIPQLFQDLAFNDRVRNLRQRVQDIESRTQNESPRGEDAESTDRNTLAEIGSEDESERSDEKILEGALPSIGGSSVTTANLDDKEKPESTSHYAAIDSTLEKDGHSSGILLSKKSSEENKDQNDKSNETNSETEGPHKEQQSTVNTNDEDLKTLLSQADHFFQHVFPKATDPEVEDATSSNDTPKATILGGFDLVPAFKCPGWPKVAMEWIQRERKWPSSDIVATVVQEGFHLVVKPPKNSGNPECDFRISFSHAEYLLSKELSEIQRDCYRCLKKYYQGYLKQPNGLPKGLVTYHLKNIFLKTVEESDAEMWNESNRAECVMMLLGKLLEALITRDLPQYFVRSYNFFSVDNIENPEILDNLAEKVVEIMEDPVKVAKCILEKENSVQEGEYAGQEHGDRKSTSHSRSDAGKTKATLSTAPDEMGVNFQGNKSYRFHELKDIYLTTGKELIEMAFNEDPLLEVPDDLERCLVENLKEVIVKHKIPAADFSKMLEAYWDMAYLKVLADPEPDMRRRMLSSFQGLVELIKYVVRQDDMAPENAAAIAGRIIDPNAKDRFDLSNLYPAGLGTQLISRLVRSFERTPAEDDIPLD